MYRKRVRTFLEYTAVPAVLIAVFLTVCLLLSLRNLMHSRLLLPAVIIIGSVIFAFTLTARVMLGIAEHRVKVHSKYTYIEIGLKDVLVSEYAGRFHKTVLRRLIIIPLEAFQTAQITKKGQVLIKSKPGAIRDYTGNTDRLGYYFKDGDLVFKEFFYSQRGFDRHSQVLIPHRFNNYREIVSNIYAAKARFESLPAPKPFVHEEMSFVKTRKIREIAKRIRKF
jgi:hypothetical protein